MIDSAVDRFGRIDILVNCAGLATSMAGENESPRDFQRVVEVNLTGTFRVSHLVARQMLDQEPSGAIINVSSILGIVACGVIPQASYAASKGGVISLTRELSAQWARRGIRVNAIAPGWFPSEMTDELFNDPRSVQWIQRSTPMGRAGRSNELDGALLFLASDASSFVTGHVLVVDGGWTAV
jgi:NAD(P)-dependent dehydrogenase (short-subunit alcohol dehydrogenase family)